ncbi:unnamed protein product [Rhizoctonia solani]|uniref:Uncharacterized protein n=2 Tax=Rhizoctonia solani TaxID=456999 RepID=A0A8H2X9I0_9AGAM
MLRCAIFYIFAVVLAFSAIVQGAPFEARQNLDVSGDTCIFGCATGNQVVAILLKLKADISLKLGVLDNSYTTGTDPTNAMNDITDLFNKAGSDIRNTPTDLTGLLNGKAADMVNLWTDILTDLIPHFDKWNHKSDLSSRGVGDIFAGLSAQLGTAVTAVQGALAGAMSGLGALGSQLLDASKPSMGTAS